MTNFYMKVEPNLSLWDEPLDSGTKEFFEGINTYSNGLSDLDRYNNEDGMIGELNPELEKMTCLLNDEPKIKRLIKHGD